MPTVAGTAAFYASHVATGTYTTIWGLGALTLGRVSQACATQMLTIYSPNMARPDHAIGAYRLVH